MGIFRKRQQPEVVGPSDDRGQEASPEPVRTTPSALQAGDEATWQAVQALNVSLRKVLDLYQSCLEIAQKVEQAQAIASMDFVNGIRQHEMSKKNFADRASRLDQDLQKLLGDLRQSTEDSRARWQSLLTELPGAEPDVVRVSRWIQSRGAGEEILANLCANSFVVHTNYGMTRASFWAENERVNEILAAGF